MPIGQVYILVFLPVLILGMFTQDKSRLSFQIAMCCLITLCAFAFRSPEFGTDSSTYLNYFLTACQGGGGAIDADDYSFYVMDFFFSMAPGALCNRYAFASIWILFIVLPILFMKGNIRVKFFMLFFLIISPVGTEFFTNAFRQSASAILFCVAVSRGMKHKSGLVFLILSLLLHKSSLLLLAIYLLSCCDMRRLFQGGLLALLCLFIVPADSVLYAPVNGFIYEVTKYLAHDNDEILARISIYASFFCLYAFMRHLNKREYIDLKPYASFLWLLLIASVLLFPLPYFSYRFVYSIYPIFVWCFAYELERSRALEMYPRVYCYVLASFALTIAFLLGSSSINSVSFF